MALRREALTPEQLKLQRAYDRSWAVQQVMLSDPDVVAHLKAQKVRLDEGPPAPRQTRDEFLAQVQNPSR